MATLTEASKKLFLELAKDAPNWGGTPMFTGTKAETGNLTDLKKKGLITTQDEPRRGQETLIWVDFTVEGKALAKELGAEID